MMYTRGFRQKTQLHTEAEAHIIFKSRIADPDKMFPALTKRLQKKNKIQLKKSAACMLLGHVLN